MIVIAAFLLGHEIAILLLLTWMLCCKFDRLTFELIFVAVTQLDESNFEQKLGFNACLSKVHRDETLLFCHLFLTKNIQFSGSGSAFDNP